MVNRMIATATVIQMMTRLRFIGGLGVLTMGRTIAFWAFTAKDAVQQILRRFEADRRA